jgi:CheY-like chemotaxis protein
MKRQNVRVIVASEYPEVQYFLRGLVEETGEVITVGQAQDASEALTLARNLRPDIAIIDCYLPYVVGVDTIPMSRVGGLDIAQTIFEEIPNTKVILLNNLESGILSECGLNTDVNTRCSIVSKGANIPQALQNPSDEVVPPNALVFANIEVKPSVPLEQKNISLSDKAIFFGGLSFAGGWLLIITIMFAQAGIFLTIAGAVALLFGLIGKQAPSLWRRFFRKEIRLTTRHDHDRKVS